MQFQLRKIDNLYGLFIALFVMSCWLGSLYFFLTSDLSVHSYLIVPGVLWMTFLYTGLFITAHDSMHRSILPHYPTLNHWIGRIAVFFYAAFSYNRLLAKHRQHHQNPASEMDPDFHALERPGFWGWYFRFMFTYITWMQLLLMALIFNILLHVLKIHVSHLILFWVAPAFISTLQLFYFGTYLPHREQPDGYKDRHRCVSNNYPTWLSFLTCYHFGYHWEHHESPQMPWRNLPKVRKFFLNK